MKKKDFPLQIVVRMMNERDPYELLKHINDPLTGLDVYEQFRIVCVAKDLELIELAVCLLANIEEQYSNNTFYLN